MTYSVSEVARILGLPSPKHPQLKIRHLLTDSRSLLNTPDDTLFFALHTPSGNGMNFIGSLYDKGVRNFVTESLPEDADRMDEANFLVCRSPLEALQTLAGAHRMRFDIPVVALTGSRGKTTVKEWANHLLGPLMKTARSPRSFNSQIGVPLSLWRIEPDDKIAIIEAGISEPGEMEKLENIIKPTIAIFTNIGGAHASGFSSIEEKCRQKATLFKNVDTAIYCADNELISSSIPAGVKNKIGWSVSDPNAKLFISAVNRGSSKTDIEFEFEGKHGAYSIPFTSDSDIENSIHCLALLLSLGADIDYIASRMASLRPVNTRLEVIEGVNGCQLIHDTYTSDFTSLAQALDFADRRMTPGRSKTLILGNLEDGSYEQAAKLCKERNVSRVILCGDQSCLHKDSFAECSECFSGPDEFLATMSAADFHDELILLKGSPECSLNAIADTLEASQHETVLEINLDAVVHNFNFFRSHLNPTTGIVCMIKASGYGAGAHELAKTLQSQGAAYLAVAVHDEGVHLRREGITMPIIVLNPTVDNFKALFDNRLEPEIYSAQFLRTLIRQAERYGVKDYPVHIKIDSGMHRLGFRLETLDEIIEILSGTDRVYPRSIFSHLCAADDPMEDDYTNGQFEYFGRCCDKLQAAFPKRRILKHILNSTGITRFPEHQLDMVRLGIGLYGIRTMHDGSQDGLRPVSKLRTAIISLKSWPAGTTIGYNRRGVLKRDSIIATVPIGYADGLNRHLGYGNASFDVEGHLCPTVGSICMDACMIDVTDVPGVAVGNEVEIFGDKISVDTLAETLQTIPYEVLTSVSERVKRVYFRE